MYAEGGRRIRFTREAPALAQPEEQDDPVPGDEPKIFVYTVYLRLAPDGAGGLKDQMAAVSEGPYESADAHARIDEILDHGLRIGNTGIPIGRVLLCELRTTG